MEVVARTMEETRRFVGDFVAVLRRAEGVNERAVVLGLFGDLGAGKTALVQCIAGVLGVSESVVSPTFVLRIDYDTTDTVFRRLVHIDGYRIEDTDEVRTIGWGQVLTYPNTLIAVEWVERLGECVPEDIYSVSAFTEGDTYSFVFSAPGDDGFGGVT